MELKATYKLQTAEFQSSLALYESYQQSSSHTSLITPHIPFPTQHLKAQSPDLAGKSSLSSANFECFAMFYCNLAPAALNLLLFGLEEMAATAFVSQSNFLP